jgi:hypothetical protein
MRLLILFVLSFASLAHAQFKWGERFEHQAHADRMAKKGKGSPSCVACHPLDARDFSPIAPGRLDHKPCIDCHGGAEFMRGNRCLTCHSSVKTFKPGKPWFPPYRKPGEFHTTFAHARHVAMLRGPQADTCGGCHPKEDGRGSGAVKSGHAACASCHAGQAQPDMNQCGACHVPGPPGPAKVSLVQQPSPFRVTEQFYHARHARQAAQKSVRVACTSCHQGLNAQEPPPRPHMQMCEGCHDGRTAFDARGTQCQKCHTGTPGPVAAATTFGHGTHRAHYNMGQCSACHAGGLDWKALAPGKKDHRPCQDACHSAEFRTRNSRICLVCHEHNDPFAPNPLRKPGGRGEFRLGAVPHPPHVGAGVSCAACHAAEVGAPATGPTGHALCGKCHTEGQKVSLASCLACHVSLADPLPQKLVRPFSTRARFKHDAQHRSAGCDGCHRAQGTLEVITPKMQLCGGCHEGQRAFKITGFGCIKCHGAKS